VVPRKESAWIVHVGPFDVHVKGTRFDASWDPTHEAFTLQMHEGLVQVSGPCLEVPRSASGAERLVLATATSSAVEGSPERPSSNGAARELDPAPPSTSPPPAASATQEPPTAAVTAPDPAPLAPPERQPEPAWVVAATNGEHARAVQEAEASGDFDAVCASGDLRRVTLLANAARLAMRTARATQAYRAIRDRFRGTEAATVAAFHLGRFAFDDAADYRAARRWFDAYLDELPRGPLAQEALGRRMEAEERSFDRGAARASAGIYLATYPSGPHAEKARKLLQQ
jgi:hypothetical protein